MRSWQRCNQFPKTHAITRKDELARNISKMQQIYTVRDFDFLPSSFVLPGDMPAFRAAFAKHESYTWIVKPSNSSCGKGIFVTSELKEILNPQFEKDCTYVVSRYIDRPLLVDSLKFDMRIYVAVTSFDPLTVYVYRDGLARFATEKYTNDPDSHKSRFQHLTKL